MTTEHEASRTLVKSPPELWAECSDAASLARHLGEFGEITITRLDPESTVAWEGEHASGTVRIEPSGWGTRVTLTAETKAEPAPAEAESPAGAEAQAPPEAEVAPEAEAEPGQVAVPGVPLFAQAPEAGGEPADVEPLPQGRTTTEEESDATMEETPEDAVPAPVDDTGRARARWRRITARMRGLFGSGEPADEEAGLPEPERPASELGPAPESERDSEATTGPEAVSAPDLGPVAPTPEPEAAVAPTPEPEAPAVPAPEPELDAKGILVSALDSLGQAHHRPFSRA